jgi:hypothetical protein
MQSANPRIQRILAKLLLALLTGFIACLVLQSTLVLKKSIAREERLTTSLTLTDNSWSDNFDDTSGLTTLQNVQVSAGQLSLINETLPGVATSNPIIPPAGVQTWGRLYFTATLPLATHLAVDVLDPTDTPVMHTVPNGGSLAGIDAAIYPTLKLRAVLSSTITGQTPSMDEWRVTWTPNYSYQIYLPLAANSFSNETEPPPPQLGAAIGFSGANSQYLSAKTVYFPSVRKNDADWNSSFAIQNITAFATTLTLEFFREDGTLVHSMNGIPLRPHGSYIALVDDFPLDSGSYALRVTATEPVVGMVSTLHASGKMATAYNGGIRGSQTVFAPRIFKNHYGWTSTFCIHNATSSTAYVTIKYYEAGGLILLRHLELIGNGVNCTNLAQESWLPSPWSGTATITTQDTDLVVTVDEVNSDHNQALGYLGFDLSIASDTLYIPRFQVENSWHTNVLVCSIGLLATESITASYHEFDGSYHTIEQFIVSPGCSTYPPPVIVLPPDPPHPGRLGSVIMSADRSELIALVTDRHSWSTTTDAFHYPGLPISSTTTYLPNVGAGLENWDTALSIQNPNPVTNSVRLIFYNRAGDIRLELEEDLPPYGMGQYEVSALPGLSVSFEGSAMISASNPIAVLASKQR